MGTELSLQFSSSAIATFLLTVKRLNRRTCISEAFNQFILGNTICSLWFFLFCFLKVPNFLFFETSPYLTLNLSYSFLPVFLSHSALWSENTWKQTSVRTLIASVCTLILVLWDLHAGFLAENVSYAWQCLFQGSVVHVPHLKKDTYGSMLASKSV